MFSQATLNNVFAGRLRSGVQPLRREISLPFLDNPKARFRFLLVRLTYVRSLAPPGDVRMFPVCQKMPVLAFTASYLQVSDKFKI